MFFVFVTLVVSLVSPVLVNDYYITIVLLSVQLFSSVVVILMTRDLGIFLRYLFPMILNVVSVILIIMDRDYRLLLITISIVLMLYFMIVYWNALK